MRLLVFRVRLTGMDPDCRAVIAHLGAWSDWVPFAEALATAPKVPGVYLAREGASGPIVYFGMAGERAGSGKPEGVRGRLARYTSGKALASGLGEAVFDRALADLVWLADRQAEAERREPRRAAEWGKLAFLRADLHVCWATTTDKWAAKALETACDLALPLDGIWNRQRVRR